MNLRLLLASLSCFLVSDLSAHPGSGIIIDAQGNVFVADINRGLLKFTSDGKTSVVLREAGHWLAHDKDKKFSKLDFRQSPRWPGWFKHRSPPGSELALISDGGSPLVIHRDGNLYYVSNSSDVGPGGLLIARLTPFGEATHVTPGLKERSNALGGIKGLASGPDETLYAITPGAVLKIGLNGEFSLIKESISTPDCDQYLPPNTPAGHEAFLTSIVTNAKGEIFVTATGCRSVLKLDQQGKVTTLVKAESPWAPTGLALQGGDLYIAEWTNAHSEQHDYRPRVRKLDSSGRISVVGVWPE